MVKFFSKFLYILPLFFVLCGNGCATTYQESETNLFQAKPEQSSVTTEVPETTKTTPEENIKDFLAHLSLQANSITSGDINQNDTTDYLVDAVGTDCGSCHSRPLYLFENDKVILEYSGDDYAVTQSGFGTITVREPIRLAGEPLCCASTYQVTTISCPDVATDAYCFVTETVPEIQEVPSYTQTSDPAPNGYYENVDGEEIPSPYYAPSAPSGASALCDDGTYSFSQHRSGTCSHHGGVAEWY